MREFEEEFRSFIDVISFGRSKKSGRIVEITFVIFGEGARDMDGNLLPKVSKTYVARIPDDYECEEFSFKMTSPDSAITREILQFIVNRVTPKETMKMYERCVYDAMYPDITITPLSPLFK